MSIHETYQLSPAPYVTAASSSSRPWLVSVANAWNVVSAKQGHICEFLPASHVIVKILAMRKWWGGFAPRLLWTWQWQGNIAWAL